MIQRLLSFLKYYAEQNLFMFIKIRNFVLILSLLFVGGFSGSDSSSIPAPQAKPNFRNNPLYQREIDMFNLNKLKQADIVMLGNSLTEGANWNELLGRLSVVERGITSDMLEGYAYRMNYVYNLKPKICFICGGLNDIFNWVPVDQIYETYIKIFSDLKTRKIIPVFQYTVFVGKDLMKSQNITLETIKGRNEEVTKLNRLLSDYAKKNNIDFINLNTRLTAVDGLLRSEFTWDGIHFKASAYKIWAEEVDKVLRKYKL
jgi:lysophospholipase L1-like esterase